jgi:hypothetical protein
MPERGYVTKRPLSQIERNRKSKIADLQRAHETRAQAAKAAHKKWENDVKSAIEDGKPAPLMPANAVDPGTFIAPRLYVSDSTVERLAVLLQARPRGMLVIADELAGVFLNMSRYSGGQDNEFWLEACVARGHVEDSVFIELTSLIGRASTRSSLNVAQICRNRTV